MKSDYGVFLGFDVGKGEHHAVGLAPGGKQLHNAALPNNEPQLRELLDRLAARYGRILVVVDQPATIGALPVTVARACGHDVAYLPGLAMRRIADLYPGNAKTDARDAYVIAEAARTLPHTLRRIDTNDEAIAELGVLIGYDDDLAGEATRLSNRIRGLLTGIHPALERVMGPRMNHPAVLETLSRCGGPADLRKAGRRKLTSIATKHAPRMGEKLVTDILAALDQQTVVVPGTSAADTVLPRLADSLKTTLHQPLVMTTSGLTSSGLPTTRRPRGPTLPPHCGFISTSASTTSIKLRCIYWTWVRSAQSSNPEGTGSACCSPPLAIPSALPRRRPPRRPKPHPQAPQWLDTDIGAPRWHGRHRHRHGARSPRT